MNVILYLLFFMFIQKMSIIRTLATSKQRLNINMLKNNRINIKSLYNPKTENQKKYVNVIENNTDFVLVSHGPAGTGKTMLACIKAIEQMRECEIDKIVITRPVVSVEEEELGFLPGNIEKKMAPWTRPIYDIFLDFYSQSEINNMIQNNKIEISPLGFMRGRTFKNAFIIADEMQNSTPNQMFMLLTRLGENSKIVITGDLHQSDKMENNGLKDLIEKIKKRETSKFFTIEMNELDIQRSNIVTDVVQLYKNTNTNSNSTKSQIQG